MSKKLKEPFYKYDQWPLVSKDGLIAKSYSILPQYIYDQMHTSASLELKLLIADYFSKAALDLIENTLGSLGVATTSSQLYSPFFGNNFNKSILQDVCMQITGERPKIRDQIGSWIRSNKNFVLNKHQLGEQACLGERFFLVHIAKIKFKRTVSSSQLKSLVGVLRRYYYQTKFILVYATNKNFSLKMNLLGRSTRLKYGAYTQTEVN